MPDDFWDNTYLVEQDGKLIRKRHPEDFRCDFCCGPLGEHCWTYPCGEVDLPLTDDPTGLPAISCDPWACCLECYPLVEAKDWQALASRSAVVQTFGLGIEIDSDDPLFKAATRAMVAHFQRFDAARTGEPYEEHAPYTNH